jgi:uncharacterized coiled-coil protein SlyX
MVKQMDKTELETRIKELEAVLNNDVNIINNLNNQLEQMKQRILQEQGAMIELKRILAGEQKNETVKKA